MTPQVALLISAALALVSFIPLTLLKGNNEDDADRAAVEQVGAEPMACALEKVAAVNGMPIHRRTLLHRPLSERTERIRAMGKQAEGILSKQAM